MLGVVTVTPLQLMIAKRVIEHMGAKQFFLVNINAHDSKVLRRKFLDVAKLAIEAQYLTLNGTGWENYKKIFPVVTKWKAVGIDKLLFASIDNIFIQYIVRVLKGASIHTFDDGSVNIIPSGVYHKMPHLPLRQRMKYYLARGSRNQNWIRKKTKCHYTIFDVPQNIVDPARLHRIALFDQEFEQAVRSESQLVKVFLGFSQADDYTNIVRRIAPDYYLPHPMEKGFDEFDNVVYSDQIAEEFIGKLLLEYRRVAVYACGSTTLLNLASERLERYVVDLAEGESDWQIEFNRIARRLGCTILTRREVMNGGVDTQTPGECLGVAEEAFNGQ